MRFLFLLLDFTVFFATTAIITTVRSGGYWDISGFLNNCKVMGPVFILNLLLLVVFSFYDLKDSYKSHKSSFIELSFSFITSFVFSAAGIYFGSTIFNIPTPKTNLLLILLIFYIYIFLSREIYNGLHFSQINIITLGKSRTLNRIKITLNSTEKYKIVNSFNTIFEIPENLDITDIDFILVSNSLIEQDNETAKTIFHKFVSKGIVCLTDLEFFENLFLRVPKETLRNVTWLIKDISFKPKYFVYDTIKRIFDLFFSICLIPFCLPLGLLIYFLILIIDKQKPILFQERMGFEGRAIEICKFRTLIDGTETPTKVGKILRKFRLDEIPQLINILDGNISVVGPRPILIKEYEFLNKFIPAHSLRNTIKPGLTGWSQLNFKAPPVYCILETPQFENEEQKNKYFKDAFVRLAYDIWYIKNASILLDLEIMLKTARRMFIRDKKLSE